MGCLIGSLTAAYTATEFADGDTPPLGYIAEVGNKKYQFVKNEGATSVAAQMCVKRNDGSAHAVEITDALNDVIQGVRVTGATAIAEDEYGYVQIQGNATCTLGASALATVAGEAVVADDDTDKGKVGGIDLDVTATVNQTTVEATTDAIHGAGHRVMAEAAVSTDDADVEVQLNIPPL